MCEEEIQLSAQAKERLELHRRDGESFDDVIRRLTSRDKWAGFGILGDSDEDPREGMARIREEMREGMDPMDLDPDR